MDKEPERVTKCIKLFPACANAMRKLNSEIIFNLMEYSVFLKEHFFKVI